MAQTMAWFNVKEVSGNIANLSLKVCKIEKEKTDEIELHLAKLIPHKSKLGAHANKQITLAGIFLFKNTLNLL